MASSLRLLDSPRYAIDYLRGLAEAEPTVPAKMALLYDSLKIALHSGSSHLAGEVRVEMSTCVDGGEVDDQTQRLLAMARVLIESGQWTQRGASLEKSIQSLQSLKSSDPENWQLRNNLGVCHFHQMNIVDSTKEFESSLQSQILATGVLSPQIIFPIQRNLFTLNEMFKK